tara:strand:- start:12214 stop:13701 length:1488 start_codon:yes stop_codon:yes gene_type:complete
VKLILALDQGTTSCRSIVFDETGKAIGVSQKEITQIYPQPGWIEHNPVEIYQTQLDTIREVVNKKNIPVNQLVACGITNQRETTVIWNKKTGLPLHNAIVWQDRRTERICAQLHNRNLEKQIFEKTGLKIDPYFSATKISWLLTFLKDTITDSNDIAFGTIDSWLIWNLTNGESHLTDVTNASRTMLFDILKGSWDTALLKLFNIPFEIMPTALPSSSFFGSISKNIFGKSIPITGVAGDQQSSLFGHAGFTSGITKNTYGTGCFMLMHTGEKKVRSDNGLITSLAVQVDGKLNYVIEGSIFIGGAVFQWMRDELKIISSSDKVEEIASQAPENHEVYLVPAFSGLGAPYWKSDVRGSIFGLSRSTNSSHIVRAGLESIAFQSLELMESMNSDFNSFQKTSVAELRVDGGASKNNLLMQIQADILNIPILRPKTIETTALGVAFLAGIKVGVFKSLSSIEKLWEIDRLFEPSLNDDFRLSKIAGWKKAIRQSLTK